MVDQWDVRLLILQIPLAIPTPTSANVGDVVEVFTATDLSFQVDYLDDEPNFEFVPQDGQPGADAGTFIWDGSVLYTPDFDDAGIHPSGSAAEFQIGAFTPFTQVSQNTTGTGTGVDPFVTITIATAGTLTITQTDTWSVNSLTFLTVIAITGIGSGILYRAGDTFLNGTDSSYGFSESLSGSRNAVGTSVNANNTPPARTIEFIPITGSNNYMENQWDIVWAVLAARTAFPDTIQGSSALDAAIGISWPFTSPASFTHQTKFAA